MLKKVFLLQLPVSTIIFTFCLISPFSINTSAANLTVNTLADSVDATPGDGICADVNSECSLRAAIMEANAYLIGSDSITFSVSGQISPSSSLPVIGSNTSIEVSEQQVILDGTLAANTQGLVNGLTTNGSNIVISGLSIVNFTGNGILATGGASSAITLRDNLIGVDYSFAIKPNLNGIVLDGASSSLISDSVIGGSLAEGIVIQNNSGGNEIDNNFIGTNETGANLGNRINGVAIVGSAGADNDLIRNTIANSGVAGALINDPTRDHTLTQNVFFNNGEFGIDFLGGAWTPNDPGDVSFSSINFPIMYFLQRSGNELVMKGFARPDSLIEFYVADSNTPYPQGKQYLFTYTEGSNQDLDARTGSYSEIFGIDTTNLFEFRIPISSLPDGVTENTLFTSTATINGLSSEFGPASSYSISELADNIPQPPVVSEPIATPANPEPITAGPVVTGPIITTIRTGGGY